MSIINLPNDTLIFVNSATHVLERGIVLLIITVCSCIFLPIAYPCYVLYLCHHSNYGIVFALKSSAVLDFFFTYDSPGSEDDLCPTWYFDPLALGNCIHTLETSGSIYMQGVVWDGYRLIRFSPLCCHFCCKWWQFLNYSLHVLGL